MPSIGGVSCDRVSGDPGVIKEAVVTWKVLGLDGIGSFKLGKNDSDFQLLGVKYDSEANVLAWVTQIENLQGSVVTVVNDRGVTTNNVLLELVGQASLKPAYLPGGDSTRTRGQMLIRGKKTS